MKITCVLITKEKIYPEEVLKSLQGWEFFDEFIIKPECPDIYTRYELALKAKNELIYVQDDDCIINCLELLENYNGQITNATTQHHIDWYGKMGITLIGFGCFFPKKFIDFKKYTDRWKTDKLFLTQTDRIFTYLNQPFNSVIMNINHLPRATDSSRMSTQPDHWNNLELIKDKLNIL